MAAPAHLVPAGPPSGPGDGPGEVEHAAAEALAGSARPGSLVGGVTAPVSGARDRVVLPSWPLMLLALPAAVAVWSGWVGIGELTGFGQVHPLPGIWDSLHLNTAVTLPIGVEAYAACALHAWLGAGPRLSGRTRRFAKWSATGSLLLGMAGQVAYHLLTQTGATRAPWAVTTAVACLPVLILGMAAGLTHMIRADTAATSTRPPSKAGPASGMGEPEVAGMSPGRIAEAQAAALRVAAAGQRVSRRTLRAAGLRGSNTDLGLLARLVCLRPGEGPAGLREQ